MVNYWVVRAGRADEQRRDPIEEKLTGDSIVGIGWPEIGDFRQFSRNTIKQKLVDRGSRPQSAAINAGQLYRFANDIKEDDIVLTPIVPVKRVLIGKVTEKYHHNSPSDWDYILSNTLSVKWLRTDVPKSDLSLALDKTLRCGLTVYNANQHAHEVNQLVGGEIDRTPDNQPETDFDAGASTVGERSGTRSAGRVTPDTIGQQGRSSEWPSDESHLFSMNREQLRQRTSHHQQLVREFARAMGHEHLWEDPIDYGASTHRGFLLAEMKTLDGTDADERRQVRAAVGQLFYYEGLCLPDEFEDTLTAKVAVFDRAPTLTHTDWMEGLEIAVVWEDGQGRFICSARSNELLGRVGVRPFEESE